MLVFLASDTIRGGAVRLVIAKSCSDCGVVMVDEEPDSTEMIFQLLGEGQGLSNQAADALAQGVVEPLDEAGLAAVLWRRPMAPGREDLLVGHPEVCVSSDPLAVRRRKREP